MMQKSKTTWCTPTAAVLKTADNCAQVQDKRSSVWFNGTMNFSFSYSSRSLLDATLSTVGEDGIVGA
jgi:hypothetical protein